MHRGILAENIPITNLNPGSPAFPFEILCFQAKTDEGEDLVAIAEAGMSVDHYVRMKLAIVPEDHVFADHTEGTDFTTDT